MKILRIDAFTAIACAIDKNRINEANQMLKIVSQSISNDKKKKTFSSYIELSHKEVNLFKSIMPTIDIYMIE